MSKKIKKPATIRKTYEASTKAAEDNSRTLVITISTKNPDRSNDEVMPEGCILENYMKNPVVAAFHNYHEPPIGKTLEINVSSDSIVAKVEFTPEGVNPTADMLYELYKGGFMNAWSIGFIPTVTRTISELLLVGYWTDGEQIVQSYAPSTGSGKLVI